LGFTFGNKKEGLDSTSIKEKAAADEKVDKALIKLQEENNQSKQEIEKLKEQLEKAKGGPNGGTSSAPVINDTPGSSSTSTASVTTTTAPITAGTTSGASTTVASSAVVTAKLNPEQIKTATINEFTDEAGVRATAGYYVVAGSFSSKENTENFKKTLVAKGYTECKYLYNPIDSYFYIFTKMADNKDLVAEQFFKIQADYKDAWVQKLE